MKLKKLKLTDVVDPIRGNSVYTKEYGEKIKGEYPVYSAANSMPLTHINHYDYDGEFLTWATNGFGGFLKMITGKFSINGDRGILMLKKGVSVDIEYLRYALQPILRSMAKGRKGDRGKNEFTKVPIAMVKKAQISIPVDENDNYDIVAQKELIKKYKVIETLENYLTSEIVALNETTLDIPVETRSTTLTIEEIFDLEEQTNMSSFTKQFVDQHKGDIPVFSASKDEDFPGYGHLQDNLPDIKYFNDILTWNIDGSVGKAFFRTGRFSLSEKVIPLILQKRWEGLIDYEFVKYVLEEKAVENGFGFSRKAGKARIKDIEIEFPMVEKKGVIVPDIEEQKQLAKRYEDIYFLKSDFVNQLEKLVGLNITLTTEVGITS